MIFHADKFIQLREEKMLSISKLCNIADISRTALWQWETGLKIPKRKNIYLLASILKVKASEISDLPDKKPISKTNLQPFAMSLEKIANSIDFKTNSKKIESVINEIYSLSNDLKQASIIIKGLLDSFDVIFYVKDTSLNYVIANKAFLKNLSLHFTYKVIGRKDSDFFNTKEAKLNKEQDYEVLHSGKAIRNIEQYIPGTKKNKIGLVSKIPILDNEDKIVGIIGVFIDITERKKAQESLELLEHNINTMTEGLIIWNEKKCLYMNDTCESIFEHPKNLYYKTGKEDEFLLKNCTHPDDVERLQKYSINRNWPDITRYRAKTISGKEKWVDVRRSKTEFEGKKCQSVIMRDVTQIVKLENFHELVVKVLSESNETFILFSSSSEKLTYFKGIEKLTGESTESFLSGKICLTDFIHPDDKDNFCSLVKIRKKAHNNEDIPPPYEARLIDKNNNLKWIKVKYIVVKKNTVFHYGYILQDITERKLLDNKINDTVKAKEIEIVKKLKLKKISDDIIAEVMELNLNTIKSF
ncbi:MAG: PAS domain-containing protein [bacterium]|nr:PAS domain-containing protein [bacterium]